MGSGQGCPLCVELQEDSPHLPRLPPKPQVWGLGPRWVRGDGPSERSQETPSPAPFPPLPLLSALHPSQSSSAMRPRSQAPPCWGHSPSPPSRWSSCEARSATLVSLTLTPSGWWCAATLGAAGQTWFPLKWAGGPERSSRCGGVGVVLQLCGQRGGALPVPTPSDPPCRHYPLWFPGSPQAASGPWPCSPFASLAGVVFPEGQTRVTIIDQFQNFWVLSERPSLPSKKPGGRQDICALTPPSLLPLPAICPAVCTF